MTYAEFASIFKEVNKKQSDREHLLQWRYPWFNMVFNYFYAFLLVCLLVSLIWWSGNTYKANKEAQAQEERDRIQAEELARIAEDERVAEEQRQKELDDMIERWAEAGANMIYGIKNFIGMYNYSEKDIETYLRCAWNRYLFYGKLTDLDVLIYTPEQFLACYKTNPPLKEYKDIARKFFSAWYAEKELLCDPSYIFAELTPKGIFLTDTFGADGYAIRWRAS